jgi:hypothetical protein
VASITSWVRLEPHTRNADMNAGLQARVYDPLWLLTRQWQVGEFQGEDNGSPAAAAWRGEAARLTRYQPGPLASQASVQGQPLNVNAIPLETLVEREPVRPPVNALQKLRFAAEAGQHFLRMLGRLTLSQDYRPVFKTHYAFTPLTDQQRALLDAETLGYLDVVMPRVPDGRKIFAAMVAALHPAPPAAAALPPELGIAQADQAPVQTLVNGWLRWYAGLFSEPGGGVPAWLPERMEYGFSLAARMADGERVLTAQEYFSGNLDWHDLNVNPGASLQASADAPGVQLTQATIPVPVTYRGMPAARFWEFEDAQVDFGSVHAEPEDLARMLLVEFAMTYGNDWFVIPVELPVGSLCRTASLVITNTFGERILIHASSDLGAPYASWRMFQLSAVRAPGAPVTVPDAKLFFLAPSLMNPLEGQPVERVLFLRDEMANLAWGVEQVIESAAERPFNRFEQPQAAPPSVVEPAGTLLYRLATQVPDYWVPLLPVRTDTGLRLRRGAVLKIDGTPAPVVAQGAILNPNPPGPAGLAFCEEEIPREGIRVTRQYWLARWLDGSTHLWIGRRKTVGRGEGSSGLQFDTLVDNSAGS